MQYDDQHVEGPFHSIRLDKVGKINYKVEDYLPRRIIERYENITVLDEWKNKVRQLLQTTIGTVMSLLQR